MNRRDILSASFVLLAGGGAGQLRIDGRRIDGFHGALSARGRRTPPAGCSTSGSPTVTVPASAPSPS